MTTLLPLAKQQFSDANGVPLAGGSVFFYIPGTTTFKSTWQDAGQVTLNTNPVILDAAGEAVIFGSGSYRQIVKDSLGNTIWDQLTSSTDATGIALGGALRGYIAGLICANNSTTKIDVSAGICTDDTNAFLLGLVAGTIDCGIVGANGLDAGALANSTWYNIFAIAQASGFTPGFLASASLTPTMPFSYTLKRRIGFFKTDGSAHIIAFSQNGDEFLLATPVLDQNTVTPPTASRTLYTLASVPLGVKVDALISFVQSSGAANALYYISSPDQADVSAGSFANFAAILGDVNVIPMKVRTNTSAQIGVRSNNTLTFSINTFGWVDTRGRFS